MNYNNLNNAEENSGFVYEKQSDLKLYEDLQGSITRYIFNYFRSILFDSNITSAESAAIQHHGKSFVGKIANLSKSPSSFTSKEEEDGNGDIDVNMIKEIVAIYCFNPENNNKYILLTNVKSLSDAKVHYLFINVDSGKYLTFIKRDKQNFTQATSFELSLIFSSVCFLNNFVVHWDKYSISKQILSAFDTIGNSDS